MIYSSAPSHPLPPNYLNPEETTEQWVQISYQIRCCCFVPNSCLTLLWHHGLSLPGSSVHGILQARILEWVAIPFSRRSSPPRDWTQVSCNGRDFLPLSHWESPLDKLVPHITKVSCWLLKMSSSLEKATTWLVKKATLTCLVSQGVLCVLIHLSTELMKTGRFWHYLFILMLFETLPCSKGA